jgi:lipopolysaccharide/colanic/teichoic acid biosynthesis glycosyltransferase
MKRMLDIIASLGGLVLLSPLLAVILYRVWRQDSHSPFYLGTRAGLHGKPFKMVKIRSMVVNADKTGVESTGASDQRITPLGHFIRRWKLDEVMQLWNVLKGDMSLVGPRPNTLNAVAHYTSKEHGLLNVKPGMTDFSSIVFSDEGDIIKGAADPDAAYDQLIRPWKSRLGLLYAEKRSLWLDLRLIWLTLVAIADKARALGSLQVILAQCGAGPDVLEVSRRDAPLERFAMVSERLSFRSHTHKR